VIKELRREYPLRILCRVLGVSASGFPRLAHERAVAARAGRGAAEAGGAGRFGTLKTELVHHRRYETREEAAREMAEYIDLFYNRQRRQARLGYLSPAAYTQQFTRQQ
jgi:transposase InsO family protein